MNQQPYDYVVLKQAVEDDLRGSVTEDQSELLRQHRDAWRDELVLMKRKAETQMTSCKARRYEIYTDWRDGKLDDAQRQVKLNKELGWRVGTTRFIQQVESRLMALKYEQ